MLDAVVKRPDLDLEDTLARALLMQSETGLIALDPRHRVVLINAAARDLLGTPPGPISGRPLPELLHGKHFPTEAIATLRAWLDAEPDQPLLLPLDAGTNLALTPSPGPHDHRLLALKQLACATASPTRRDSLTGLPDHAWFTERLALALDTPGSKPVLLLVGLDRPRAITDRNGHPIGDALLKLVAKRLTAALRNADVISRLSAHEFAVVMKRPRDPEAVARRLIALLSRPYLIEGATASIGAAIRIALAPEHGTDPVALIAAARATSV